MPSMRMRLAGSSGDSPRMMRMFLAGPAWAAIGSKQHVTANTHTAGIHAGTVRRQLTPSRNIVFTWAPGSEDAHYSTAGQQRHQTVKTDRATLTGCRSQLK